MEKITNENFNESSEKNFIDMLIRKSAMAYLEGYNLGFTSTEYLAAKKVENDLWYNVVRPIYEKSELEELTVFFNYVVNIYNTYRDKDDEISRAFIEATLDDMYNLAHRIVTKIGKRETYVDLDEKVEELVGKVR